MLDMPDTLEGRAADDTPVANDTDADADVHAHAHAHAVADAVADADADAAADAAHAAHAAHAALADAPRSYRVASLRGGTHPFDSREVNAALAKPHPHTNPNPNSNPDQVSAALGAAVHRLQPQWL